MEVTQSHPPPCWIESHAAASWCSHFRSRPPYQDAWASAAAHRNQTCHLMLPARLPTPSWIGMRIGLTLELLQLLCESCIFLLLFLSKPSDGRDAVLSWPPYTCLTLPGSESVNRIQHGRPGSS